MALTVKLFFIYRIYKVVSISRSGVSGVYNYGRKQEHLQIPISIALLKVLLPPPHPKGKSGTKIHWSECQDDFKDGFVPLS